jgi:hypothetical protein
MRTTLSLDPDVAERLAQEIRRTGKGMKVPRPPARFHRRR